MVVAKTDALLPTRARGCQIVVEPGMRLSELGPDLRYWIQTKR